MRIDSSGRLLVGTSSSTYNNAKLQVAGSNSTSYISMLNTSASDSDGFGYNILAFRRRQSGGEESTSAFIIGSHDGTGDDQKGRLVFGTNDGNDVNSPTERMRIDSSGNVGIGTASAKHSLSLLQGNSLGWVSGAGNARQKIEATGSDGLDFYTGSTPSLKATITSGGNLEIHGGELTGNNGAGANDYASVTNHSTPYYATNTTGISHKYTVRRGGTYGYWEHGCYGDNYYFTHGTSSGGASRPNMVSGKELYITSNGSIYNSTGTYSTFSDVRIKENIVDANDQWNDIKALRLVNYNLIGGEERLLGFVAQEVEQTSPGLVDIENPGLAEDADLSEQMKVVKTSIIYMKAVKALQEAMERIETLESEVAALKAQ
jgi:hypothetical protein